MVRAQKEMLQRFEKTNEMLTNVNSLSAVRLEKVGKMSQGFTDSEMDILIVGQQ